MASSYTRPSDDIKSYPAKADNPLNQYSSLNCLFTLAAMSKGQVASRKFSPSDLKNIIASSKGDWGKGGKNRVVTEFGSFDYFIDDVIIASTPSHSAQTGNTAANKLSFKVTEPYSMALFYLTLQAGATASGYLNYKLAPFLLMIEFVGYRDDNKPYIDPNLTRYIPISINKSKMKVTGSGTVYEVEATPYNEKTFADQFSVIKRDYTLQGSDVMTMLAGSGEGSLNRVIQRQFVEDLKDKIDDQSDKIEIHFPKDFTDPGKGPNVIASSKLFTDFNDNGTLKFPNQDAIFDSVNQIYKNSKVQLTTGKNFHFEQNMKIQDIITEIILRSDYITKQLTNSSILTSGDPARGMLNWFRIEANILDGPHSKVLNRQTHTFIYRVIPFEVHVSKLIPATSVPPGYDNIKKTVLRIYDYIYTGNNTQIQNLELDFNSSFFSTLPSDGSGSTAANVANMSLDATGKGDSIQPPVTGGAGSDNSKIVAQAVGQGTSANPKTLAGVNGSGTDNPDSIQVRTYQALLTNPADLVKVTMTILGDPYYVPSSGMGNQIVQPAGANLLKDGSMNHQNGEVDVVINFRTPVDLDPVSGMYRFMVTADEFSGLYFITKLESKFSQNKFTNVLYLTRRRNQIAGATPSLTPIFG
jgi:hypothetical protein